MRASGIIGMVAAAALSACAPATQVSAPVGQAIEFPVDFNNATYIAKIAPGPAGEAITAAGAVPVQGATIRVRPAGEPFETFEGKLAKDVAAAACTSQGRRFNPTAIGDFAEAEWIFRGACA
ncbi:MAG: hypothetical protein WCC57_19670 [Paracoccaceae bacterium]